MLYVAPVLGSAWSPLRRSTLRVVAGWTVLTLLGSTLPPLGLTIWFSGATLILVLASVWVAAVIVHLQNELKGAATTVRTTGRAQDEGWQVPAEPRGREVRRQLHAGRK